MTLVIVFNALLVTALVAGLALVMRVPHRLREPVEHVRADEERELPRAA